MWVNSGGATEAASAPAAHEKAGDKAGMNEGNKIASPNPTVKESEAIEGGEPRRVEGKPVKPDAAVKTEPVKPAEKKTDPTDPRR